MMGATSFVNVTGGALEFRAALPLMLKETESRRSAPLATR